MFLSTLVFCAFVYRLEAHYSNMISNEHRNHLFNVIKALNADDDSNRDDGDRKEDDNDLNDAEKEEIVQEILRLLKRGYTISAKEKGSTINSIHGASRLYFIKNPEVLDEYKNYLKVKISNPINYNPSGDLNGYKKYSMKDNLKHIKRAILRLNAQQNSEDNESYKPDKIEDKIKETRKNNSRIKKIFKEKYSLHDDNDSLDERNKKYDKNKKRNKGRFTNDDLKLNVDIESDLNGVEGINRKPFSNKVMKNKGKSKKFNEMKSFDDFKERNNKPKSDFVYRKPLNEKVVFSFGRTHIPYIGKKGIYDEK